MSNPPSEVVRHGDALYELYVHVHAMGKSIREAIELVPFSRPSLYAWKDKYKDWVDDIEDKAIADSRKMREQKIAQLVIQKLQAQADVEQQILDKSHAMAVRLLDIVETGDEKASISAARELRNWLRDGFAFERENHSRPEEPEPAILAFNPHEGGIDLTNIRTRSGDKVVVTIENKGQVVDVTPT